jgi:hypothetical protein
LSVSPVRPISIFFWRRGLVKVRAGISRTNRQPPQPLSLPPSRLPYVNDPRATIFLFEKDQACLRPRRARAGGRSSLVDAPAAERIRLDLGPAGLALGCHRSAWTVCEQFSFLKRARNPFHSAMGRRYSSLIQRDGPQGLVRVNHPLLGSPQSTNSNSGSSFRTRPQIWRPGLFCSPQTSR